MSAIRLLLNYSIKRNNYPAIFSIIISFQIITSDEENKRITIECPPHFDNIYCWPFMPRKSMAKIQCPLEEDENAIVTRWCTDDTITEPPNITRAQWEVANTDGCSSFTEEAYIKVS